MSDYTIDDDVVYFVYIDSCQVVCEFNNFCVESFHDKDSAIEFASHLKPFRSRVYVTAERDLPDFEYKLLGVVYEQFYDYKK